ncbi:MAG: hypothetical protein EXR61_03865 [Chloroflexi bacterium]|nr:hypothetical protein [Chloroflexota bacterium]
MSERVILADCCEDWIIDWGGFYLATAAFACPECRTAWTKSGAETFRRADGREFRRSARNGPEASFPYLAATDGDQPNVDRCCAKILLAQGERLADGPFGCPVCRTVWQKRSERLHGIRLAVFAKNGLPEPLAIQPGRTRPFLVPLSEYSPPRD